MKRIILSILVFSFSISVIFSQSTSKGVKKDNNVKGLPEIIFEKTTYDYGIIQKGSDGLCEFIFKNTGKQPLLLTNCISSCGCTVPKWPKEPIKNNQTASIKVKYNTNRIGNFSKTITVYSNAKNSPVHLTIKGKVEKPVAVKKKK